MKTLRPHVLLALLAIVACKSDTTGPGETVASVQVTPDAPSVDVGLTVQFSAQALNGSGQPVGGLTTNWASSNTGVATIDNQGLATAVSVGTTAITATIGGVSASEVLIVEPSQCDGRVTVVLNPGEFQSYDATECLLLPSGDAGDRYRVAITRPTQIADESDTTVVTLDIDPIFATAAQAQAAAVAAAAVASPAPAADGGLGVGAQIEGLDGTRLLREVERMNATRRFHHALRERERGLEFAQPLESRSPEGPLLSSHGPPPDSIDMFLSLECAVADARPVRLIDFNDDIAVYQDQEQFDATPLTEDDTNPLLAYYASYVRDMIADYWGPIPDVDSNERVIVVTSPTMPENAAAAVFSGDLVPTTSCTSSNEAEVIYFEQDVLQDLGDPTDPGFGALSILAHEMKHVVSLYEALQRGQFHTTWVEEGTAEVAQTMSSRIAWADIGGPPVGAVIDAPTIINFVSQYNQANGTENDIPGEMWGVLGQIIQVIINFTSEPNSLIANPDGAAEGHTFYAASWHLHRLIGDAWGNASTPFADAPLFRDITDRNGPAGVSALTAVTGRTFDQLFEDVVVAASLHRTGETPPRDFSTWNLVTATDIFTGPPEVAPPGRYPWPVTGTGPASFGSSNSFSGLMGPSGVRFHDFGSNGQGLGAQISVTGAGSNGRIVVSRLR